MTKNKWVRGLKTVPFLGFLIMICFMSGCEKNRVTETRPEEETISPFVTPEIIEMTVIRTLSPAPLTPSPSPTAALTPVPDPWTDGMERETYRDGFYAVEISEALKERMTGYSYPKDWASCKVPFDSLRYLRVLYVDFEGEEHQGELVVNKKLAMEVLEIFSELYDARYPLTSVRLVDDFGEEADDNLSMAADNTSSFCYRKVTGTKKLSLHSYGMAIDINPMRNPYVKKDGTFSPVNASEYLDRTKDFPGKIDEEDACCRIFTAHGWSWGGHMKKEKDYQHFSKDIR